MLWGVPLSYLLPFCDEGIKEKGAERGNGVRKYYGQSAHTVELEQFNGQGKCFLVGQVRESPMTAKEKSVFKAKRNLFLLLPPCCCSRVRILHSPKKQVSESKTNSLLPAKKVFFFPGERESFLYFLARDQRIRRVAKKMWGRVNKVGEKWHFLLPWLSFRRRRIGFVSPLLNTVETMSAEKFQGALHLPSSRGKFFTRQVISQGTKLKISQKVAKRTPFLVVWRREGETRKTQTVFTASPLFPRTIRELRISSFLPPEVFPLSCQNGSAHFMLLLRTKTVFFFEKNKGTKYFF